MKWWDKILDIGLTGEEDIRQVRYVHILNGVMFLGCFFTAIFIPFLFYLENYFYAVIQSIYTIIMPLAYLFCRKKQFRFAAFYIYVLFISNLTFVIVANNDVGAEFLMIPASLSAFVILKKRRDSLIVLFIFMACCAIAQIAKHYIDPIVIMKENFRLIFYYFDIFVAFTASASIMLVFLRIVDGYEDTVLEQKQKIEERNKEITDSIRYAKRIQQVLLPNEKYIDKTLKKLRQAKEKPI